MKKMRLNFRTIKKVEDFLGSFKGDDYNEVLKSIRNSKIQVVDVKEDFSGADHKDYPFAIDLLDVETNEDEKGNTIPVAFDPDEIGVSVELTSDLHEEAKRSLNKRMKRILFGKKKDHTLKQVSAFIKSFKDFLQKTSKKIEEGYYSKRSDDLDTLSFRACCNPNKMIWKRFE